ncbi:hypothetical protein BDFB_002302 [Asbolus verrucosus]|uniref:Uncharacterized protein n=1 Tax=Asbolus verrucosus TaxID=1661398 RepID=A0A482VLG1_ASBVE|nr:hypothetical protein BDFB_002302 [Asbolus verrucosus]
MTSTLHQMYKNLEKCTESLEHDVKTSLEQLDPTHAFDENVLALEGSKDYHYKQILDQLRQIKEHIRIIADHDQSIQSIQAKISKGDEGSSSRIDKNYIKKQVETFQKFGVVNRRLHKPVRPHETSSMKFLESWERILEDQDVNENPTKALSLVIRREESLRRKKKVISSTVDTFLESVTDKKSTTVESPKEIKDTNESSDVEVNTSVEPLKETEDISRNDSVEAINEVLADFVDTKPRIVDVIVSTTCITSP